MDGTASQEKTFFGNPHFGIVLFGAFCFVTVIALTLERPGNWLFLPLAGLLFADPFIRFVRFGEKKAVLFIGVIPFPVTLSEIAGLRFQTPDMRAPESPAAVDFDLKNGKHRRWELKFFSAEPRKEIKNELEKRVRPPSPAAEGKASSCDKNLRQWVRLIMGTRAEKIILSLTAGGFLLGGAVTLGDQLNWNRRLRTWTVVEGTILKNATKRVRSGKGSKTISDIEYVYTYRGQTFRGSRILYGNDHFPSNIRPGAKRRILVDPDAPRKSAAIVTYRGYWGLIRYFPAAFFLVLGGIFGSAALRSRSSGETEIPWELSDYLESLPEKPQIVLKKTTVERKKAKTDFGTSLGKMPEYRLDRYCILPAGGKNASLILFFLHLVFASAVLFFVRSASGLLLLVFALFFLIPLFLSKKTVIDLREKKLFRVRTFTPGKTLENAVSIANWDHLELRKILVGNHPAIVLSGGKRGGEPRAICHVAPRSLPLLLAILPEFARKLGNLPVDFL